MKLIDNLNRHVLSEGRSYQMGFAFLKKTDENTYTTVQPISPCKDYLNDVVWAEFTNRPISAYGLIYNKLNIYDNDFAYIVISMCQYKYANSYNSNQWIIDVQNLKSNYKNINLYINEIEKLFKLDNFTTIKEIEDNKYFICVPIFWVQYTYLISLYSLLIRACQNYTPDDGDVLSFLSSSKILPIDIGLIKTMLPKLHKLLENGIPVQDLNALPGTTQTHNMGICGFKF